MANVPIKVKRILDRFESLKAVKKEWDVAYQKIGEYVRLRRQDFTESETKGEFLTEGIYDTTAVFANRAMSAALLGSLFPNSEKTVRIDPPEGKTVSEEVKEYFSWVTKKLTGYMGKREARLATSLDEYMQDAGAFGWGGVNTKDDKEDFEVPLKYSNWDPKNTYYDEDSYGNVNTVYFRINMLATDAEEAYGLDKLSDKAKQALKEGKASFKIKVLVAVQPRKQVDRTKKGNRSMPYGTYHIDIETKEMLKESGLEYLPPTIARFFKNSGEVYGRGPGSDAFPVTTMANAQNEAIIRAAEKQLDPPMAIVNDGTLGTEVVNTSAGGLSVLSYQGRLPVSNPMFPLYTVGEMSSMKDSLKESREQISQHFLLDRLLDFNNEVQMTLGEVQIREQIRGKSLSAVFNRQITEMFDPLIKKSFNILFARGFLGVTDLDSELANKLRSKGVEVKPIPEEVQEWIKNGEDVYEIKYISPAMRIMEKEEVVSALTLLEAMVGAAQIKPEIGDYLNEEKFVNLVGNKTGGNNEIINTQDAVDKIRKGRSDQAQQQQGVENAEATGRTLRDVAQAQNMIGESI